MAQTYGKKEIIYKPDGQIRRSQIVSTFGPGAMVDLLDDAVLVGGLEYWLYDKKTVIVEPRLRDHLAERLQRIGVMLSFDNAFREPPIGDEKAPSRSVGVQTLEFPQWFVCQSCRALVSNRSLERKRRPGTDSYHYLHACNRSSTGDAIPVRFVGACRRGHIQDFPWVDFVHFGKNKCAMPELVLREGKTGDFSEIEVQCKGCEARTQLVAAMRKESGLKCFGHRPWLGGKDADEGCKEDLRLIVRTASNSYFAQVTSALSIPDAAAALVDSVKKLWTILQTATKATLPAFRTIPNVSEGIADYTDEQVLETIESIKSGKPTARKPLRTAEFEQLIAAPVELPGELPDRTAAFWARRLDADVPAGIGHVVLVFKLREVRAQVGFTRIAPLLPDMQGSFESGVRSARLSRAQDWLPASEILGEGVFIQFDETALQKWEARVAVRKREQSLRKGYEEWAEITRAQAGEDEHLPPFPGARFYLLHSLAHLLLAAVSLECGYSASSIRERIYCAGPTNERGEPQVPMAGILLSTGSSGSEGTLGGLVEQGRRLQQHLQRAFELGVLCSNDPVCALHSPHADQAERHLEGAACHGCLYAAECSCEWFNRYLDRALVVPTLGYDPELAFFQESP
jgi:hypothetical protein